MNEISCRICYREDGKLFSPCLCSGSMKYVHSECLEMARDFSKSETLQCRICKYFYKLESCETDYLLVFYRFINNYYGYFYIVIYLTLVSIFEYFLVLSIDSIMKDISNTIYYKFFNLSIYAMFCYSVLNLYSKIIENYIKINITLKFLLVTIIVLIGFFLMRETYFSIKYLLLSGILRLFCYEYCYDERFDDITNFFSLLFVFSYKIQPELMHIFENKILYINHIRKKVRSTKVKEI